MDRQPTPVLFVEKAFRFKLFRNSSFIISRINRLASSKTSPNIFIETLDSLGKEHTLKLSAADADAEKKNSISAIKVQVSRRDTVKTFFKRCFKK